MAESTALALVAVGSLAISAFIGFRLRSLVWIVVAFFISVVLGAMALEDESGGTGVGILIFFTTFTGYVVGRIARMVHALLSERRAQMERASRDKRIRQDRES